MAGILFEDIFDVKDIDPDGKKFERGEKYPFLYVLGPSQKDQHNHQQAEQVRLKSDTFVPQLNAQLQVINTMYPSLTSHTLCREEGSGRTAPIKLLLCQKLDVTNQITSQQVQWMALSYYLTIMFDNCVPWQQLDRSDVTTDLPLCEGCGLRDQGS